jgi:hypothetical protein
MSQSPNLVWRILCLQLRRGQLQVDAIRLEVHIVKFLVSDGVAGGQPLLLFQHQIAAIGVERRDSDGPNSVQDSCTKNC